MTCSNCSAEAIYALEYERVSPVYYCGRHLPAFLRAAASKGQLNIKPTDPIPTPPSTKKRNASAPVVAEPVAEEPVVEEPVVEDEAVEE